MKDQVNALARNLINALYIGPNTSQAELTAAENGKYPLLYMAPEKAVLWLDSLRRMRERRLLCLLAIDEAHCVSEWGHDFRPEYSQLWKLKDVLTAPLQSSNTNLSPNASDSSNISHGNLDYDPDYIPVMCLTATCTPHVIADVVRVMKLKRPKVISSSVDRANLRYLNNVVHIFYSTI